MTLNEIKENITNISVTVASKLRSGDTAETFAAFGVVVHNFEMSAYRVLSKGQQETMVTAVQNKVNSIKKRKQSENERKLALQNLTFTKEHSAKTTVLLEQQ